MVQYAKYTKTKQIHKTQTQYADVSAILLVNFRQHLSRVCCRRNIFIVPRTTVLRPTVQVAIVMIRADRQTAPPTADSGSPNHRKLPPRPCQLARPRNDKSHNGCRRSVRPGRLLVEAGRMGLADSGG